MGSNRFYVITSIFILAVLGYLTYNILEPFFSAIAWAAVLTIVFYPVYRYVLRNLKSKFLASSITVVIILLVIIGPVLSLALGLLQELRDLAQNLDNEAIDTIKDILAVPQIAKITGKIQSYLGFKDVALEDMIVGNLRKFGEGILNNLSEWLANVTKLLMDFILMSFAIFFLLRDGPDFLRKLKAYLPFADAHKDRLATQVKDMVVSTVYGGVTVAAVQGILGGIAFFALDIKSPAVWGSAMAIMSFLPMLGTFVIWGPASGYLLIHGSYAKGIGLLVFGTLVIGIVDNILQPAIVSGRTKMPTLLIFFSVLGGLNFFGLIGFIMGPLVMALFISVFSIFRNIEGNTDA